VAFNRINLYTNATYGVGETVGVSVAVGVGVAVTVGIGVGVINEGDIGIAPIPPICTGGGNPNLG